MAEQKATDTPQDTPYIAALRQQLTQAQQQGQTAGPQMQMDPSRSGYGLPIAGSNSSQAAITKAQDTLNQALQNQAQGVDSDGKPLNQTFNSLIDPATGLLQSKYQLQAGADVTAHSAAADKIRQMSMQAGPSDWAQSAYAKQGLGETDQMNAARNQSAGAQAQSLNALMMQGGLSSGARERIGNQSDRAQLMASQNVGRQGQLDRAGIDVQDQTNKNQYLNQAAGYDYQDAGLAQQNRIYDNGINQANITAAIGEVGNQRAFDQNQYNQQMQAWAANKSADAQKNASSGGGGCCFIFLEARYGNGTMDKVVRRFRDEHMTTKNKRGYYKLSEVLVPLMRKSKVAKFLVRLMITDPLISYGKYHYGEGKIGVIFTPIKNFWLSAFNYLGDEHEFIRENGETV